MARITPPVSLGHLPSCAPSQTLVHPKTIHRKPSEEQRRPQHCANSAQQQLKHYCAISIVLLTNLKHHTSYYEEN